MRACVECSLSTYKFEDANLEASLNHFDLSYELKSRDVERRFFTSKLIHETQHRIVTGNEKWILMKKNKRKTYYAQPSMYYELLNPGETIVARSYRLQLFVVENIQTRTF